MFSRVVAALVVVACCVPTILGQQASPQPQATFRVQVDAVEIDAAVTDARGNVVTDLTAADFEVLEDGKPQTITSFARVDIPREPNAPLLATASRVEPDVFANNQGEGRVYVIALDEVPPDQALRTRNFLRRFLDQHFAANDLGAVVFLGRANQSNGQDFTSSRQQLMRAIETFTGGFPDDPPPPPPPPPNASTDQSSLPPPISPPTVERDFGVRRAMSSFRAAVEFMATVHGRRKALLLFSTGYPMDIFRVVNYRGGVLSFAEEDAHRAVTTATRNNVVIYPIDPRGLQADGGLGESESGPSSDPAARQASSLAGMDARQSLVALATATGGFALTNSNSFDAAFDRIVQENSSYYVLGFSSTNERRDGRFRQLQVRVRRPGLVVRSRNGYIAPLRNERRPPPPTPPSNMSLALAEALTSAVPVNGMPIRVFAAPYKGQGGDASVPLSVEVGVSELGLAEKDGTYVGTLEVTHTAIDSRNRVRPGQTATMNLNLRPETYAQVMRHGMRVLMEASLPAGRHQIRVAAGNRQGKAGSVVYHLDVPDFTREPLVLSGVSLTSQAAAVIMTTRSRDPLSGLLPGPAMALREFDTDDTVTIFVEAYENARNATAHTVDLSAELRAADGRVVREVREERSSTELGGTRGGYGFTASLPLDGLAAGLYVIHVEARARGGAQPTASRNVPIRVR